MSRQAAALYGAGVIFGAVLLGAALGWTLREYRCDCESTHA